MGEGFTCDSPGFAQLSRLTSVRIIVNDKIGRDVKNVLFWYMLLSKKSRRVVVMKLKSRIIILIRTL